MRESFPFSEQTKIGVGLPRVVSDSWHMHSDVTLEIHDKNGNLKHRSEQKNLRVNGGADFWNTQLFSLSPGGAGANYIALSTDTATPLATDTTLPSEIVGNGLSRAQATLAHTAGTSQSQFTNTYTYTGSSPVVIAKVGLFNAASVGTLVLETLLTSTGTVNTTGDTISVTWTINY
jgi:hypothetical protein